MNHQIILVCLALINTRPSAPLQSTSDDCMFFFFWNAPFTLRYLRRGFLILEGYVVAMAFNIILNWHGFCVAHQDLNTIVFCKYVRHITAALFFRLNHLFYSCVLLFVYFRLAFFHGRLHLTQLCPTRGPEEGFVRHSLGFHCNKSILHDNLSSFWYFEFDIPVVGVFSATLSRLLPLQFDTNAFRTLALAKFSLLRSK